MAKYLKGQGYHVMGVDIKETEYESAVDDFYRLDLREWYQVILLPNRFECESVFQLAADMGGMLFISQAHSQILHNNALINLNVIEWFKHYPVRYFFSSSACAYPESKQDELNAPPLKEDDAWSGMPQDAYGVEKLFSEQLAHYYGLDKEHRLNTHVARFHNCFGPQGSWTGGREKAPAALCRKVAEAKLSNRHSIEVIGDGQAQRTFMYVSDCVEGIYRLTQSDHPGPMNLGSTEQVTVDELAYLISSIANWEIEIVHVPGPQGVRSRNSDNSLAEKVLGWTPQVSLRQGLEMTYPWIEEQVRKSRK
jgi:GDP-D-mannose 3',5'-epimerase